MLKKLEIQVVEDTSSVRLKNHKWIDPRVMKTSTNQSVPYYSIDCMIKEVSKNLKISINEILQSDEIMVKIQKKWVNHFNKLIEIYIHHRIGMVLLGHHQEIFYNKKNAENKIYPFCDYPNPMVKVIGGSNGNSSGGKEIIDEFNKKIYVFLNNKYDATLKYDLSDDHKIKYYNFLINVENYLNEKEMEVKFFDKNEEIHKYKIKFTTYNSDFYDRTSYYGPKDFKYFEDFINLKDIENKIGFRARKSDPIGSYYFYECDECLDKIDRTCKSCRSKKTAKSFFPLTFQGTKSNKEYNNKNIVLWMKK